MSSYPQFGHAKNVARAAVEAEAHRLEAALPNTGSIQKNLALIKRQSTPEQMTNDQLYTYVDLLARSMP